MTGEVGDGLAGLLALVAFVMLGLVSIAVGVLGWNALRIGLVVDRHGVWCSGFALFKRTLIPWEAVLGVSMVTWTSPEGEHESVVIGLREDTIHPAGQEVGRLIRKELERLVGDIEYSNPLVVGHDEWDWQPDAFAALVSRCIEDSSARDELGDWQGGRTMPQRVA